MGSVLLGARMLLAAVFATAGVAKLLDRRGSHNALRGFGVPPRLVPVAVILLPLAELGTAVALVPTPTAQWGGLAALFLLLAFAGAIGNAMRRGRAPDCHCFGQLHSAPAGPSTLLRNLALAAPAAYVAIDGPGPSVSTWIADRTAAELIAIAACLAAAFLGALAVRFWRESRTLTRDLKSARDRLASLPRGLPVGAPAPGFTVHSVRSGAAVTLDKLLARARPVTLIFVSPGCGPCEEIFEEASRWQVALAEQVTIAVISEGDRGDNVAVLENGSGDVLLQDEWEVGEAYRVGNTPTAVAIAPDGRVASPLVSGEGIEPLIRLTVRQHGMGPSRAAVPREPIA
jgi:hypothetical protein